MITVDVVKHSTVVTGTGIGSRNLQLEMTATVIENRTERLCKIDCISINWSYDRRNGAWKI